MTDFTVSDLEKYFDADMGYYSSRPWTELLYEDEFHTPWGLAEKVTVLGGVGNGAATALIFKIGDRLFRKTGYYSSWGGDEWDGPVHEVEPYQKTITAYREV